MRAQGRDCLESEQVLTYPSLQVCNFELPKLKAGLQGRTVSLGAGGMVMPERLQGKIQGEIQGAAVGEEDIAAVGLGIGSVDAVGEEDYLDLEWREIGGVWRVTWRRQRR